MSWYPGKNAKKVWRNITGQAAADEATKAQKEGTQAAIDAQRAMFDEQMAMLKPFYERAGEAQEQMGVYAGLQGAEAQQAAIDQLQNDPTFQALQQQQESAMLQNASATGGLRGGNMQGALAQFRPAMLQNQINQQMAMLGGISGQSMPALGMASGAMGQTGQTQAGLLQQMGQMEGANRLAQYQMGRDLFFDAANFGVDIFSAIKPKGL